jgi:hypothetical protein
VCEVWNNKDVFIGFLWGKNIFFGSKCVSNGIVTIAKRPYSIQGLRIKNRMASAGDFGARENGATMVTVGRSLFWADRFGANAHPSLNFVRYNSLTLFFFFLAT